jgi:hypothetical protein
VEAEKFIQRRLKTGSWKMVSETREEYYLNKMIWLEARVSEEIKAASARYDRLDGSVTRSHPIVFTELEKLAYCVGCSLAEIPRDYQDFLLTLDGFMLRYRAEKDSWGSRVDFRFLASYSQPWFQEHEAELPCLQGVTEPFIVVSVFDSVYERKSLSGGVLFPLSHKVVMYDEDIKTGEFKSFRDYFEVERLELIQRLYDARGWVDRKAD